MLFFKWIKKGFFRLESASINAPELIVGAYYSVPMIEELKLKGFKCIIVNE
jgi:hypothetical protein